MDVETSNLLKSWIERDSVFLDRLDATQHVVYRVCGFLLKLQRKFNKAKNNK